MPHINQARCVTEIRRRNGDEPWELTTPLPVVMEQRGEAALGAIIAEIGRTKVQTALRVACARATKFADDTGDLTPRKLRIYPKSLRDIPVPEVQIVIQHKGGTSGFGELNVEGDLLALKYPSTMPNGECVDRIRHFEKSKLLSR